jgi:hypothetical protein
MKYERELWEQNGFPIIVLSLVSASDGILSPRSAHAWPSTQSSIDTSRNLSAHVSSGLTNSKNFWSIFSPFQHFSFITKKLKNQGRGVPQICFHLNSYFFLPWNPMQNFRTLQ